MFFLLRTTFSDSKFCRKITFCESIDHECYIDGIWKVIFLFLRHFYTVLRKLTKNLIKPNILCK